MTKEERNAVIQECLNLIEGRGNAAAQIIENPLATVAAHRAAVAALNFYNQTAADLRGLKQ
jgi:hypothetical protein